jgi:hypothetical protein
MPGYEPSLQWQEPDRNQGSNNMGLTELWLKLAFQKPGCPICRLRQESEDRYLFNLLYEHVTDGITRMHLVHAMGLCSEHSWMLQATEFRHWHDGLGVGIIYEDLTERVLQSLYQYQASNSPSRISKRKALRQRLEHMGWFGRWLAQQLVREVPVESLLQQISPVDSCPACRIIEALEDNYLHSLVRQATVPEFRSWYAASDGLCLPHLRRALAYTKDEEVVRFLVEEAARRLGQLRVHLQEYVRKHAWDNRHESKTSLEQSSWIRAVAFFAGECREEREDVDQLRQKALDNYHKQAVMSSHEQ